MKGVEVRWFRAVLLAMLALAVGLVTMVGCGNPADSSGKIKVAVSILPQSEFVERVGGDKVDVTIMVPPGASPHTYELKPSQMKALAKAKMYAEVGSGVQFEVVYMDNLIAANREMLVVDCSAGVDLLEMTEEETLGGEEHDHGAKDPHIWMSPLNAKIMVQNICAGLVQIDPDNEAYYKENCDAYLRELTQLDQDIRDGLAQVTNRRFMVYHPAYGYFAKEYDLIMLAIEKEGKEPTAAGITHLVKQAKEHNIKVIFASPQFNPQTAKVIANAIGGSVIFIDPLAKDYVTSLRALARELIQAMQ
ncbi:MAG: zinc ABC transporter substrate-binding protein [Chloroflexi bacterium]|nr:zinc ABC transporter substrate-binding protein [Chloroflexota bacterium]